MLVEMQCSTFLMMSPSGCLSQLHISLVGPVLVYKRSLIQIIPDPFGQFACCLDLQNIFEKCMEGWNDGMCSPCQFTRLTLAEHVLALWH